MPQSTAVITGGANGIGRAVVNRFVDNGYRVIYLDVVEGAPFPPSVQFICTDVSVETDVSNAFGQIAAQVDGLDVVVNNAAVAHYARLIDTEPAQWDRVMAVNVRSVYLVSRAAYPLLKKRPASGIVNVASVHACATSKSIAAYAASKGAVVALTRAMSLEMAEDGIRVNCVLPGAVDTAMLRAGLDRGHLGASHQQDQLRLLADKTPLARIGTPEEIAEAVFFLATAGTASFITGQTLIADGGALAGLRTE